MFPHQSVRCRALHCNEAPSPRLPAMRKISPERWRRAARRGPPNGLYSRWGEQDDEEEDGGNRKKTTKEACTHIDVDVSALILLCGCESSGDWLSPTRSLGWTGPFWRSSTPPVPSCMRPYVNLGFLNVDVLVTV
ncbi:hypothetical protein NL676_039743 [Syzygium grande]|nr:hypothetical protein NL676_039743 [Syzygium grande]